MGERLQRQHGERDVDVERWRERVAPLLERWQAVLAQTDVRQRELEQLGRQLRYYRESADPLDAWLQDAKQRQEQIQAVPLADSQAVREQLRQEKVGAGWAPGGWKGRRRGRALWPLTALPPPGPAGGNRAAKGEGGGVPTPREAVHQRHQGEASGLPATLVEAGLSPREEVPPSPGHRVESLGHVQAQGEGGAKLVTDCRVFTGLRAPAGHVQGTAGTGGLPSQEAQGPVWV